MNLIDLVTERLTREPGLVAAVPDEVPTVGKPTWTIEFAGADVSGQSWRAMCMVNVTVGPAWHPAAESMLLDHCGLLLGALSDLNIEIGDLVRLPDVTPAAARTGRGEELLDAVPFATAQVPVIDVNSILLGGKP